MNVAAIAEQTIVEELVDTVPTSLAGVLALLKFQRDYSEGSDFLEGYLAAFLMKASNRLNRIGGSVMKQTNRRAFSPLQRSPVPSPQDPGRAATPTTTISASRLMTASLSVGEGNLRAAPPRPGP